MKLQQLLQNKYREQETLTSTQLSSLKTLLFSVVEKLVHVVFLHLSQKGSNVGVKFFTPSFSLEIVEVGFSVPCQGNFGKDVLVFYNWSIVPSSSTLPSPWSTLCPHPLHLDLSDQGRNRTSSGPSPWASCHWKTNGFLGFLQLHLSFWGSCFGA